MPGSQSRAPAIRDLARGVEPYFPRSRFETLLAFGSHRFDRDDGCTC